MIGIDCNRASPVLPEFLQDLNRLAQVGKRHILQFHHFHLNEVSFTCCLVQLIGAIFPSACKIERAKLCAVTKIQESFKAGRLGNAVVLSLAILAFVACTGGAGRLSTLEIPNLKAEAVCRLMVHTSRPRTRKHAQVAVLLSHANFKAGDRVIHGACLA